VAYLQCELLPIFISPCHRANKGRGPKDQVGLDTSAGGSSLSAVSLEMHRLEPITILIEPLVVELPLCTYPSAGLLQVFLRHRRFQAVHRVQLGMAKHGVHQLLATLRHQRPTVSMI